MPLPQDYNERVYAGVLGKLIGVYLGRPFEGWSYESIMEKLGEVNYYVHEKLNAPLVVTDDDISGTFTFLRALPDYGNSRDITPEQIGQTWLNYLIEKRTVLWWGGLGNSTEHTAYLRLKNGIKAPESGSIATNSKVVAEQIGAQIFIDGWGMVAPGDPEFAAELARRAGSVSHDGEAVYAAQVVAGMEAQAFVESDINALLDVGVSLIPKDSVIATMITDIREWREKESDWRKARELLAAKYGYDKYGGNCHVVPNHGLIILSLLYGDDDFQKTLMIVNTCGWDTDCNSGNVGCLMGIKNGLEGIDNGPDWRGPIRDRLFLPTADGGRSITDAVSESIEVINIGRALASLPPIRPKDGARFHFSFPGSVQGFGAEESVETTGTCQIDNALVGDQRCLAIRYQHVATGRVARVSTPTFLSPDAGRIKGYHLIASPTLYSGQKLRARVKADSANQVPVYCRLYIRTYEKDDELVRIEGPGIELSDGKEHDFEWIIPDTLGAPIAEVGLEISSSTRADGVVYLDFLTWDGQPEVTWTRPDYPGSMWYRAWTNGVDHAMFWAEPFRLVQDEGTGLLIQGTREWTDYRVEADVTPHMVSACGLGARVQGMRRYYALLLTDDRKVRLVKALDGETVLAEADFDWVEGQTYQLSIEVEGSSIKAWIDEKLVFEVQDSNRPLSGGAVALVCTEGRTATQKVQVKPIKK